MIHKLLLFLDLKTVVVMKMILLQARAKLRHHSAAMQVPIGLEEDFKGLIDLVQMKAYYFHGPNGSVFNAIVFSLFLLNVYCHF